MVDPFAISRLLHYGLFAVVALGALLISHLPLSIGQNGWPTPQVTFAFAAVWILRRPDFLPVALIATVAIMSDFLMQRPPGLWAALTILALEFLRTRSHASREWPVLLECAIFALILGLMLVVNRLVLAIFVVDQSSLGIEVQQLITTAAFYPFAMWASVYLMGVKRLKAGHLGSVT